ncbi:2OG-Fe(II) oxygenase [Zavarzinella formosa]|uniref:2OG-Fe(II) oxygenase n=1 Tax=Zavarzinella formosa TaxID=360055 RepID=UPI0002E16C25|nr:2OG-Fe(II) oxygenase [Zavarzinella formosa]
MDALLKNEDFMRRLANVPPSLAHEYQSAQPFAHTVFDDFFPADVVDAVHAAFPNPKELEWFKFDNSNEVKLASSQAERMPTVIREFLYFLNSKPMLSYLEKLTGIEGLIPDPSFTGGGLHQIQQGGKLGVHIDFNKLESNNLDRRLNLIVYMNKNWKEEYGGKFELWDAEKKGCVKSVLPVFNRCVVFSTHEKSYHGHPHPLTCPEGETRKSVALYYYSNGRPENERGKGHSTVFLDGDSKEPISLRETVKYLTPPVVVDAGRWLMRTLAGKPKQ